MEKQFDNLPAHNNPSKKHKYNYDKIKMERFTETNEYQIGFLDGANKGYSQTLKDVEKMINKIPYRNKGFMQNVDDIQTFKDNLKQSLQKLGEK